MNRFLLIAALALYGGLAIAQQLPKQLPNEADLKAAYCSSVVRSWIQVFNQDFSGYDADVKKEMAKLIAETEEDLRRLESYLFPRMRYLDLLSITAAVERGKADVARNQQDGQTCREFCPDKKTRTSCLEKCRDDGAAYKRIAVCGDLSFLPF